MFLLSAFLCGHYILKKRIYQGKRDLCRHIIFMQYTAAFFCESKKLRPYLKERSYCFKARINRRLSIILLNRNNSITFKSLFESTTYRRGYCRRVGGGSLILRFCLKIEKRSMCSIHLANIYTKRRF